MTIIPELIANGKRVIDLSADFRFNDPALYESVYQRHTAKELLGDAVYGLSEIYSEAIQDATLDRESGLLPNQRTFADCTPVEKRVDRSEVDYHRREIRGQRCRAILVSRNPLLPGQRFI